MEGVGFSLKEFYSGTSKKNCSERESTTTGVVSLLLVTKSKIKTDLDYFYLGGSVTGGSFGRRRERL